MLGFQRLLSWLALLLSLAVLVIHTNADTEAEQTKVPFSDFVGLTCTVTSDCGYLPSLSCIDGVCDYCRQDTDCASSPTDRHKRCHIGLIWDDAAQQSLPQMGINANGEPVAVGFCVEKDLFAPFTRTDFIATLMAFLSTAMGSGGGIGGGGLLVPLYIFITGFSPKHAIPLSKATIFGNAVAMLLFNFVRKHPNKPNVPITDFAVSVVMEPMTLVGSIFGVMLNHILPNWVILLLLITLLSFITYKTYLKGNKIRGKETNRDEAIIRSTLSGKRGRRWSIFRHFDVETAAKHWLAITRRNKKQRQIQREDEEDFKSLPPLPFGIECSGTNGYNKSAMPLVNKATLSTKPNGIYGTFANGVGDDSIWPSIRQSIERREARTFPIGLVLPLIVSWVIVFVQALLRGGHGAPSIIGIECNSTNYWLATIFPLGILIAFTLYTGRQLRLENRLKVLSGYKFTEGDIHWTKKRVIWTPLCCTLAGVAAGLLGIGGGMVKGPIMLEMGMLPPVQSATTSFMVLFTSSSTTLQFAINDQFPGTLQYDYIAWFVFAGFLGGLCGQKVVAYCVKKYKRESIIVYLLSAVIGLSAVAMGIIGFQSTLKDIKSGLHLGFHGICGTD